MGTKSVTKAAAAAIAGTWVHAYRREADMVLGPNGQTTERHVEVVACGEKIKFKSNEEGHVIGLVRTAEALHRLVKEIPEAYIVYQNGDNVPEKTGTVIAPGPQRPEGDFILESGEGDDKQYMVLDDLDDAALRTFAADAGLEAFPEALVGDDLRRAIFNQLSAE